MDESLLLGMWRCTLPIPPRFWQSQVKGDASLDFMSEEHHRVRNFAVRELPRVGGPLPPDMIAVSLGLSRQRVIEILDELEAHMTFVFRNDAGAVTWAYPVTVEHTPHRLIFGSGEQIYAA